MCSNASASVFASIVQVEIDQIHKIQPSEDKVFSKNGSGEYNDGRVAGRGSWRKNILNQSSLKVV